MHVINIAKSCVVDFNLFCNTYIYIIHSEPASDQMASLDFIEDIADFPGIFCISMLMKIRKAELDDHKQAVVSVMCKESERLGRFC